MTNPKAPGAIAQGCTCPVMDNSPGIGGMGLVVMAEGCPVHGERLGGLVREASDG